MFGGFLGCARWKALDGTPSSWSQIAVTPIRRAARTFAVRSPDRPSKATRSLHKSHPTSLKKSGTSNSIRKCNKNLPGTQRRRSTAVHGPAVGQKYCQTDAFQWETTMLQIQVSKISALAQSELAHPGSGIHVPTLLPQVRALRFTGLLLEVGFAKSYLNFLVRPPVRARWGGEK